MLGLEADKQTAWMFDHGPFDHRRGCQHQRDGFGFIEAGLVAVRQFPERRACAIEEQFPACLPRPGSESGGVSTLLLVVMETVGKPFRIQLVPRLFDGIAVGDAVDLNAHPRLFAVTSISIFISGFMSWHTRQVAAGLMVPKAEPITGTISSQYAGSVI